MKKQKRFIATMMLTAEISEVKNTKEAQEKAREWKQAVLAKYGSDFASKVTLHPLT